MTQIITNNGGGGGVGLYKYKGSVDYYEDLPSSGMKVGDTYNVVNAFTKDGKDYPAGTNVAWTGTDWDPLGGSIDLSDYQKKLVEGEGIDLDQDTNEISVDTTVIATKQDLTTKQDVISDLATIRNNASAGKTAKDTIDTYGNIVTHNVSEFANAAQGEKADTALQPNDNISELNNDSGFITSEDLPDLTPYQLKSNMVTSLNSADDTHYPTAKAVKDAITSSGGGDVSGPSSSVDGHLAVFDGATGKVIKDGGTIPTPTTVVDNLNSTSATSALSANQGRVLNNSISTINGKIPSAATTSNQLADKQFVNDAINSVTAYYITKDAQGSQFATYAELDAATVFYSGGVVRVPTRNDYTIVLDDETHNDEVTRYIYNSDWEYQYTINKSPLTQAQLDALNSGITSGKVSSYDSVVSTIAGYGNIVTHNTSEFATSAQGSKADTALQPNDNISELNNDAGYITGVNWGDIEGTLSNQVDLNNALIAKANDDNVVHKTGAETINGTKTFGTSPVVPSKTSDATNTGTSIATEAQVYKKQDTLVSGTNIKTINNESILGSGNITIQEGTEYNAGEGIEIRDDYSAMQGPAPSGFHVPSKDEWTALCGILTTTFSMAENATTMGTYLKMPMAGRRARNNATIGGVGVYGYYWSFSPNNTSTYSLRFGSSGISTLYSSNRAYGSSVRCFKNTPVIPTSSWTTLYDGSSISTGAGVFYNATDGLISVSGDGQTWYTIQDKNLGATTVFNQGDTETDANCGYFYQWGNNYGFPHSGDVTTSDTKVDASNYGPGNYYNSSTYITVSVSPFDWSSVQNDNLWGGVTGIIENTITNTGVLSVNGQTGDVTIESGGITNDTTGTTTRITGIRGGTEAEYGDLSQKDSSVLYFTF